MPTNKGDSKFADIVLRKLAEPALAHTRSAEDKARILIGEAVIDITREEAIAERFVKACEAGKPWAMQILADRVMPKVVEVDDPEMRSLVDVIRDRQAEVRAIVARGVRPSDLPDIIDVTPTSVTNKPAPMLVEHASTKGGRDFFFE